jgi:hypothetical protein
MTTIQLPSITGLAKTSPDSCKPFNPIGIAFGKDQGGRMLEVLVAVSQKEPSKTALRSAWKKRQDSRGVPLLLVVIHIDRAYVCGPSGDDPPTYPPLDINQVERVCNEAIGQADRHMALQSLRDSLGTLDDGTVAGLRNEGFLASHELSEGVPTRSDWKKANEKAKGILKNEGHELLASLGFIIEPLDKMTSMLKIGKRKGAAAILLDSDETPESGSSRFPGNMSPVSYALARAEEENLDWVILMHGRKIRLYPVNVGIGVGQRGRTETWVECHTALISIEQAAYLWLLFSAEALKEKGTLEEILSKSRDFAGELATKLRERIYDHVIPPLAEGIAKARKIKKPKATDLSDTYQMAMRILFRVLFIAYGEDKDLLPYRFNGLYEKRSLKTKAHELQQLLLDSDAEEFGDGDALWQELAALFKAVDQGNATWGVPAYNGGLFASDSASSKIGALLSEVSLPDSIVGPALIHLLLVPTHEAELGPVDFRALGVREFGTIYEGLLESELSLAESDLVIETKGKNKDSYRPAKDGEEACIKKGSIYLHNASGARKSTGSYYTKPFAVEHLLDKSLEPALDDHFARLDALDDLEASESFFDFRVADIAMGSAHFLVAAVDRIEARFSSYLSKRPLVYVSKELDHLRNTAIEALGSAADSYPDFEDNALLRRQIARRCIYGVDINEVAVQLARLALWIHTFVPGLPLSLLDRNLVHGNSLIGIAQLSEFNDALQDGAMSLFQMDAETFLGDAKDSLARLGKIADATNAELKETRKAWEDAEIAVAPSKAISDIITAYRIDEEFASVIDKDALFLKYFNEWEKQKGLIANSKVHAHALGLLKGMNVIHFPIAFPEVFIGEKSGFDVILGNPPWEELMSDIDGFWARHYPGLRGLSQREKESLYTSFAKQRPDLEALRIQEHESTSKMRRAIHSGPFPGMGTGDVDLYKAFSWRFWYLTSNISGQIGVVLPRSVLCAKGSEDFRKIALIGSKHFEVTIILNNNNWFFEEVHPQYTIALISIQRTNSSCEGDLSLSGPYNSRIAYDSRTNQDSATFPTSEVLDWNEPASMPLLPTPSSIKVYRKLLESPSLGDRSLFGWKVKPFSELHATNDKKHMDLVSKECPENYWPIYKGASFDIWNNDSGTYYAWASPEELFKVLQKKRSNSSRSERSAFYGMTQEDLENSNTLPCNESRIAFRNIGRATDTRTFRCALLPPNVFATNAAPYFVWSSGNTSDKTYLLGVLSSLPLDWFARRFIETTVNFFYVDSFPIPDPHVSKARTKRIVELAGRLACPDKRFADWAKEVCVEYGPLEEEIKQDMIHELDAVVAHLYGLTEEHLVHIFETFHVGWDYHPRLDATLKHYKAWEGKS